MFKLLASHPVRLLLEKADNDLALEVGQKPCPHCGGKLHRANYLRKPRGMTETSIRQSFCCSLEGCRKRVTPGSVRYFGRKQFPVIVVVLVSAMSNGLSSRRVAQLRKSLGIGRATLHRWRRWWLKEFVQTKFWKAARARLIPRVSESELAADLCVRFEAEKPAGLLTLLKFLRPITTGSHGEVYSFLRVG